MTEDDARAWITAEYGVTATERLARFLAMVVDENGRQNLIAPSTIPKIWVRHALDSAQLLRFDRGDDAWLDIGTGGGFPGMVVAFLRDAPVVMVEPRSRRAQFLQFCVERLELASARVHIGKVEQWHGSAAVISARAVASLDAVFRAARHCAGPSTRWVLPKGRSAMADVAEARRSWRGMFHVEQSIVASDSSIVIVEGLEPR